MVHKLFLPILSVLILACCSTTPNVRKQPDTVVVDVRMFEVSMEQGFSAKVHIYEWSELPGIVSEVYLPDGYLLVEYFDTPNGKMLDGQWDNHWVQSPGLSYERYIFTYPAEVEGADKTEYGFAELPQNRDGSVRSNTDPKTFNLAYHRKHKRQGKIVSDRRDLGRWWRIIYNGVTKEVTLTMDAPKPSWWK